MNDLKADLLHSSWDERILELLACPACHGNLRPQAGSSGIACIACHRVYPLEDGIPVLISDRATGSA